MGAADASATATVTATVTVTATPTPSPSPPPAEPKTLSKQEAGKVYLQTFRPWNETAGVLDAEVESAHPSLNQLVVHAEEMAKHNLAAMKTLQGTAWPKAVRADIDELYRELSTFQGLFIAMAERAETVDEFYNIYMTVVDKSHTGTSQRIRLALGLKDS